MGLGHGLLGAMQAVQDEFAEETVADLAGDVEVVFALQSGFAEVFRTGCAGLA